MPNRENNARQKILFVINPISGDIDKSTLLNEVKNYSVEVPFDYRVYYTKGEKDAEQISDLICEYTPDKIVAVGGDGTCNLVGSMLLNREIVMGIIPLGSANGLAKELEIPQRLEDALNVVVFGNQKKIDALSINGNHISFHLCDIGLNAKVVERFEKGNLRGFLGYARHFLSELAMTKPLKVDVELDRKLIRKKAYMVIIANASQYGTGAIINPEGKIDDGLFELIFIRPYSFFGLLRMFILFFTKPLYSLNYVDTFSCRKAVIHNLDKNVIQVDGEIIGRTGEISVEIMPQCLRIMTPGN